jgi:acetyl esterase/lipase
MQKILIIILLSFFNNLKNISAQTRYLQRVFNTTSKISNAVYGNAPAITSVYVSESITTDTDLKMDIFQPSGDNPATLRPLIVLIHAGGFITGSKNNQDMQNLCDSFACRGYVTCAIDYRKNFNLLSGSSAERAVYRGLQDGAAAIRYMKAFRNTYKIDTNYVFAWGSSAGGFTALNLAYLDDSERPASTLNSPNLGCISCSGNNYPHHSKVNAVVNCWGAIGNTNWINASNNNVPAILFHGNQDNVVPYNTGNPFGLGTLPPTSGSSPIAQRLNAQSIYNEFYTGVGQGHEYWGTTNGTFTGAPTADYQDIINKTAIFLYGRLPSTPMNIATTITSNITCSGSSNGAVTANATGGGYGCNMTYKWSNGQTTATATNLAAGTYFVTATCGVTSKIAQVNVPQPSPITFNTPTVVPVTCNGNGSAAIIANNGTGNFSYLWSNNQMGNAITITNAGTYTVTATDANGCKKSTSIIVPSNAAPPSLQLQSSNLLTCSQTNATLSNADDNPTYTYLWQSPSGIFSNNKTLNTSQSGTYFITVTNTSNNCKTNSVFSLIENKTLPSFNAPTYTLTCINPSLALNNTLHLPSYNYFWQGSNFSSNQIAPIINAPDNYTVTITDIANGCKTTKNVVVGNDKTSPIVTFSIDSVLTCKKTSIILSNTAHQPNYNYVWHHQNGTTYTFPTINITEIGTYTTTVTNVTNGCKTTKSKIITANQTVPTAIIQRSSDKFTCAINTIVLDASNSIGSALTYQWSGGTFINNNDASKISIQNANNYTVTVTDGVNDCFTTKSIATTVFDTIAPIITISGKNIFCKNDSVVITANSINTNQPIYTWSNGNNNSKITVTTPDNYCLTVTNSANSCATKKCYNVEYAPSPLVTFASSVLKCNNDSVKINTTTTDALSDIRWYKNKTLISNQLSPFFKISGLYEMVAKTNFGCQDTFYHTVIGNNKNMSIELLATVDCDNNAVVNSKIINGKPPYIYQWNNNATTTASITVTAPNTIYLTITDAEGCVVASSPALQIDIYKTVFLTPKIASENDNNKDGSITMTAFSPYQPLQYLWSNGEKTKDITNLSAGKYCVTVTDANGCEKYECYNVAKNITTATTENNIGNNIVIYPNPTKDIIFISKNTAIDVNRIDLYNEVGILKDTFAKAQSFVSLENQPSGVYFLCFFTNNGKIIKKIVKY